MNTLLLILMVTVFILLRLFIFKPYTIKERDSNNIISQGDYVLVNKNVQPELGDLVLYVADGRSYVARVVGAAGDKVTIIEDFLYRNNELTEEPYLEELKAQFLADTSQEPPFTPDFSLDLLMEQPNSKIPQDNYLLLNDNRLNQEDSRQFGLIPRSKIKGVLTFRLYPLEQFGFLPRE